MKTILHAIDTSGPGGAETLFVELVIRLQARGYRPVVVARQGSWVSQALARHDVGIHAVNAKGSFNLSYLAQLVKIIKQQNVVLIQSHLLGSNVYCSLAGLFSGVPVMATFHGAVDIGEQERLMWLKAAVMNSCRGKIIAVTDRLAEELVDRAGIRRRKIRIIYNGIDTQAFMRPRSDSLRERFNWNQDTVIVGSLGNIRPAKGYDILVQVAALLNEARNDYRFVIAGQGKGELFEGLRSQVKESGLEEKIVFLGFVDDAGEFLSNLDVFLSTSVSEGLPLSAIQAMASRLPIVVTRCGGYEKLVTDGVNGKLVEIRSPRDTALAIENVISDPGRSQQMADNARRYALDNYDVSNMIDRYVDAYEEALH